MSSWKDYVTSALLGVEKGPLPQLPAPVAPALAPCELMDRETRFLTQAGALALWRRAGWKPPYNEAEIQPAEPETTTPVSGISAGHLRAMLGGHCDPVLPEWLREVARRQRHVPPEFLPALLERARQNRALRSLVAAAGGQRAVWLSGQNPDWAFSPVDTPETWETGSRDQRAALLRLLRATAPAEARARIESVWKSEPADVRLAFLAVLEAGLADDDIPFLETALDDRSKEVRRVAIDLLARLPQSSFVARMMARASSLLAFKRGGLLSTPTLEVALPPEPDSAGSRDGIDPKAFGNQKTLGNKAVLLVLILSATPLQHWTDTFQQTPAAILKAAEKNEFAGALITGWAWAALRQRNVQWAEAILEARVQPHAEFLPGEPLLNVLPEPARAARLAADLRAGVLQLNDSSAWQRLAALLDAFQEEWPPALAHEVLSALRRLAAVGIAWHLRAQIETIALRLPQPMLTDVGNDWPTDQDGVSELIALLTFRHDALTALAHS